MYLMKIVEKVISSLHEPDCHATCNANKKQTDVQTTADLADPARPGEGPNPAAEALGARSSPREVLRHYWAAFAMSVVIGAPRS